MRNGRKERKKNREKKQELENNVNDMRKQKQKPEHK
jgi:hypothetical protein